MQASSARKVLISVQLAFARQGAKEQGRAMMIGAGRMTAIARADTGASEADDKRGSEVCVQTCDDARQLLRRSRLGVCF